MICPNPGRHARRGENVAQASSLRPIGARKLEACATLANSRGMTALPVSHTLPETTRAAE
jgi:hypothetical protein